MLLADSFCNETWIQISTRMMISDLMVSRCVGIWWLRLQDEGLPALQLTAQDILAGRRMVVILGLQALVLCKVLACDMLRPDKPQGGREDFCLGSKSFRLNIFRKKWPSVVGPCWQQFPDADSCRNFPSGTVQKPIDCFNFWLAVLWVQQLGPFGGVLEPFLLSQRVALRRGCSLCEA